MTELVLFWTGFKKEVSMYGMGDIGRVAASLCTMVRFGAVTESLGAFFASLRSYCIMPMPLNGHITSNTAC